MCKIISVMLIVVMIACGRGHSLFIDTDGVVWVTGRNGHGQLGLGHTKNQQRFTPLKEFSATAIQVSAIELWFHSAILDHQGDVWVFGRNLKEVYAPKILPDAIISTPTRVHNLPKINMISCGYKHKIAIDGTGNIWGIGDNSKGQLSAGVDWIDEFTIIKTPDEMGRVIKIICDYLISIALTEKGELWGTGCNVNGELGLGHNQDVLNFQKIPLNDDIQVHTFTCGRKFTALLDTDGVVWTTGNDEQGSLGLGDPEKYKEIVRKKLRLVCDPCNRNMFTRIPNIPPVVFLVCGGYSTIFTDLNGIVYACGNNQHGQLGLDVRIAPYPQIIPGLPKVVQGCLNSDFSLLVDEEGGLWASGLQTVMAKVERKQNNYVSPDWRNKGKSC